MLEAIAYEVEPGAGLVALVRPGHRAVMLVCAEERQRLDELESAKSTAWWRRDAAERRAATGEAFHEGEDGPSLGEDEFRHPLRTSVPRHWRHVSDVNGHWRLDVPHALSGSSRVSRRKSPRWWPSSSPARSFDNPYRVGHPPHDEYADSHSAASTSLSPGEMTGGPYWI